MCTYLQVSSNALLVFFHRCIGTNLDSRISGYSLLEVLKADGLVEICVIRSSDPTRRWIDSSHTSTFSVPKITTFVVSFGCVVWSKSTRWFEQAKAMANAGSTHLFINTKSKYSLEHILPPGREGRFPRGRGRRLRGNLERHQIIPSSSSKDHVDPPTVPSSDDLGAFFLFFFDIFGLYARGLLALQ